MHSKVEYKIQKNVLNLPFKIVLFLCFVNKIYMYIQILTIIINLS